MPSLSPDMDYLLPSALHIVGIIANVFNILVYRKKCFEQPTNNFLLWISMCDLTIGFYDLIILMKPDIVFNQSSSFSILIRQILVGIVETDIWLSVLVAAVYALAKRLNAASVNGVVVGCFFLVYALNGPSLAISIAVLTNGNSDQILTKLNSLLTIGHFIIFGIIPFVLLIILTVVITFKRSSFNNRSTTLVVLVTTIFVSVTYLPTLLLQLTWMFDLNIPIRYIFNVVSYSTFVQVSAKFFIYYACSAEFRRTAHNLLWWCCKRRTNTGISDVPTGTDYDLNAVVER